MEEGYYWIRHCGVSQIAYYSIEFVEDMRTGIVVKGVWYLIRGHAICNNNEVELLKGPISLNNK